MSKENKVNKVTPEQKRNAQKIRTARNQIKRYEKALETIKGPAREVIQKKIDFYKERLSN